METIRVNMTPCEDAQTIHASQNDGKARQWGFELHNNGDVIDSSEITDQITFKSYKGGTEELLPSSLMNGFVDLGSLEWTAVTTATSGVYRMRTSGISTDVMRPSANTVKANIYCSRYSTITASESYQTIEGIAVEPNGNLFIYDSNYNTSSSVTAFKDSLQGVYLWYQTTDSTPTTSPINADIKYPQGLLTDQEFTFRQSPTESDGLAKIQTIYGNTLKWNQLASTLPQTQEYEYGLTFTNNNDGSITINGTSTNTGVRHPAVISGNSNIEWLTTHIYLINFANTSMTLAIRPASAYTFENGALTNGIGIFKPNSDLVGGLCIRINANASLVFDNYRIYPQVFDLTKMFGEAKANEIYAMEQAQIGSGVSYFKSLFPLNYYPYDSGSLISFMGNGIKTVGKNLWDNSQLIRGVFNDADFNHSSSQVFSSIKWYGFANTTYTVSWGIPVNIVRRIIDGTFTITTQYNNVQTFTLAPSTNGYIGLSFRDSTSSTTQWNPNTTIQIEEGSTVTGYEPYTSSTLSLPISTYFPNGMKSAGSVYDELTETKAITRVGAVDLGSLSWVMVTSGLFQALVNDLNTPTNNLLCKYTTENYSTTSANMPDKSIKSYGTSATKYVYLKDSAYSTVESFKSAMSGVYLYYELATESETTFSTASLVTENAEIPLSNEDGVLVGKCIEELSENPGFFDAKIKLADEDGECYSNKLQLHIERSPQ